MTYSVKEMYLTIQGEGAQTGLPAVFLRFAGCNLWSGLERDRAKAVCKFCDTDFVGTDGPNGGKFKKASDLADRVRALWPDAGEAWVVCTGGEPLLQLDTELIDALHHQNIKIAIETNGTIVAPDGTDWICVSPKADAALVQTRGDELKLVYPQKENHPRDFESLDFSVFSLQPLDDADQPDHIKACTQFCLENPKWRLSLQTHKMIGID